MEILRRKITTEKTLEKRNVSCETQAAKTPAMIVPNTKFSKKRKAKNIRKNLHQITTKLERHTENVCERMSKDVRKHRYRLPRATLQLKLSTRMIHPTRHHTSATPQKHRVDSV